MGVFQPKWTTILQQEEDFRTIFRQPKIYSCLPCVPYGNLKFPGGFSATALNYIRQAPKICFKRSNRTY